MILAVNCRGVYVSCAGRAAATTRDILSQRQLVTNDSLRVYDSQPSARRYPHHRPSAWTIRGAK